MKLVLATNNRDKIAEIRALLSGLSLTVLTRDDFAEFPEIAETAQTLAGNAELKATGIYQATGVPALADDTGLEVAALGGAPGVFAARYAGEGASYTDNCRKLLCELKDVPSEKRQARFRCVIALDWGDGVETCEGEVKGTITESLRGAAGFGYDPVFYYPPLQKTFAQISTAEKNEISHRGLALVGARKLIIRRINKSRQG